MIPGNYVLVDEEYKIFQGFDEEGKHVYVRWGEYKHSWHPPTARVRTEAERIVRLEQQVKELEENFEKLAVLTTKAIAAITKILDPTAND